MTPTGKIKIGHVTLREHTPGQWRIRYGDPVTGKDVRIRLSAGTYADAVADAERYNRYCRGEVELPPHELKRQRQLAAGLTVQDAMTSAESQLNYGKDALRNYRNDAARFREFAEEEGITRWKQVDRKLIRKYYQHMKSCQLAHDTIRLRLLPISVTAAHWALESDEYCDEFRRAQLKHKRPRDWEPEISHLTLEQSRAYLQHLRDECEWKFHAMAMFGLYCGLRQLEIVSLRPCDIDVQHGIITVTDTEVHAVKTEQSKRQIPVPQIVIDAIRVWPINPHGLLFKSNGGCPYDANMLGKEWRKHVFAKAKADEILPSWFTAKRARPTFATLAGEAGVDEIMLQRMMGHAPTSTLARFYRNISVDSLRGELATFWQLLTHGSISEAKSVADAS